ncbi:family 10 glycosylhydrolase [Synechocystis sp. PCC 7509]|uniref:family 10 glycosylhydrolase n=1 Tax=Synechocystis sp. PCC 7509 TaxID=927677 RepID=UPI0003086C0E|nr:family 10 glycosylhydrolase [Synechocystis sp. PCC 7509]
MKLKKTILSWRKAIATSISSSLVATNIGFYPAQAQTAAYCQFTESAKLEKQNLLQATLKGDTEAQNRYQGLLNQHSRQLQECRSRTWPQVQAIWLRLYPCDLQAGKLDEIMDRIINLGYNQVYVEVFADGQVLLPMGSNRTAWPSVVRAPGSEKVDLLAQAIQKGHERGLKVYAWMFMMNFGYSYGQRSDRQSVLARNGKGQTSLYFVDNESQVFVDPYNLQAKRDYYQLVNEIARRRPDGVLFDYVRYPRGLGANSVITKVQDLWIYGDAAQLALSKRALNSKGLELIGRYAKKGSISVADVAAVDKLYPQESEPLWQGRTPPAPPPIIASPKEDVPSTPTPKAIVLPSAAQRQPRLQWELWQLSVAHAIQGVLDFLAVAAWPVQRQGIKAGAVFFPDANQTVGQGYDSRLQPWHRFPKTLEWHAMAYANCGNAACIAALVQKVTTQAPEAQVIPAIAGVWGKTISNRPSLEAQMQAIRTVAPQVRGVSHFAFSWQEPQLDSERKSCQARRI